MTALADGRILGVGEEFYDPNGFATTPFIFDITRPVGQQKSALSGARFCPENEFCFGPPDLSYALRPATLHRLQEQSAYLRAVAPAYIAKCSIAMPICTVASRELHSARPSAFSEPRP